MPTVLPPTMLLAMVLLAGFGSPSAHFLQMKIAEVPPLPNRMLSVIATLEPNSVKIAAPRVDFAQRLLAIVTLSRTTREPAGGSPPPST